MGKRERKGQKTSEKRVKFAPMPNGWVTAPLFPPLEQEKPYTVCFGENDRFKWTSGCENPFNKNYESPYLKGFDIRHYDLIALFISEIRKEKISKEGIYSTGYKTILESIGKSIGSKQIQYINNLLDDLWNTNLSLEDSVTGEASVFRALSSVNTEIKNGCKTLVSVQLSPEFIDFINRIQLFIPVRLDIKTQLPSPVAQSMYTYLPSRAVSYTKKKPWKISLTKLMTELQLPVEKYPTAFRRKTFFTQNKTSILSQLNGLPVASGHKFRVDLAPTKDGKDYNLLCWVDKIASPKGDCKVYEWWIESGGKEDEFYNRIRNKKPLDGYVIELLSELHMRPKRDHAYFEILQALYPGDFNEMIGEMHYRYLVGTVHNPNGFLIWTVKNAFYDAHGKVYHGSVKF